MAKNTLPRKSGNHVHTLRIELAGITPTIWRRVRVPGFYDLISLHDVIQGVLAWDDSHMHEFIVKKRSYSRPDMVSMMEGTDDTFSSAMLTIDEAFPRNGSSVLYVYDFGDDWLHKVTREGRREAEPGEAFPQVVAGEGAPPIEDCGGAPGFMMLAEIARRGPRNEDDENFLEWAGGRFDPDKFDLKKTARRLKSYAGSRILVRRRTARS